MKRFYGTTSTPGSRGCVIRPHSFELPERDRLECPDCLERALSLSEAEVMIDSSGAAGLVYEATCSSCGFTVRRDESYGVPLVAVLDAIVMLDLKLAV